MSTQSLEQAFADAIKADVLPGASLLAVDKSGKSIGIYCLELIKLKHALQESSDTRRHSEFVQ